MDQCDIDFLFLVIYIYICIYTKGHNTRMKWPWTNTVETKLYHAVMCIMKIWLETMSLFTRLSIVYWIPLAAFPSTPSSASSFSIVRPCRFNKIKFTINILARHTNRHFAYKFHFIKPLSYHCRSTRPPRRAITAFTRFAKSMALSPAFLYIGGRYQTSQTIAQLDIIMYKYCIIEYRLLFQNASPNLGSYCICKK